MTINLNQQQPEATATRTNMTTSTCVQRAGSPMRTTGSARLHHSPTAGLLGTSLSRQRSRPLVGNFEESILNNRLQADRVVEDYSLEVRTAPYNRSLKSKVRVSFFSAGDSFPYLGQAHIGQRAFKIPKKGTLQVTLFNPNGTLVKLFLLQYDLTDMPPNSQTFLRQKTLLLLRPTSLSPCEAPSPVVINSKELKEQQHQQQLRLTNKPPEEEGPLPSTNSQVLRDNKQFRNLPPSNVPQAVPVQLSAKRRIKYMIQLNIVSSKSNRIYLNKDLRIFISKKSDLETATQFAKQDYELKSFDEMPSNPRYFSR